MIKTADCCTGRRCVLLASPKGVGLGFLWRGDQGGQRGFSLRGSLKVQGKIIMPYLTLDLGIAGGELLVNCSTVCVCVSSRWPSGCFL